MYYRMWTTLLLTLIMQFRAKLNPVQDSLAMENSSSFYSNILAVKAGNENTDAVKALKAALESQKVADFITEKYQGSIISVVQNPGNGFVIL